MTRRGSCLAALLAILIGAASPAAAASPSAAKKDAVAGVDALSSDMIDLSRQVWGFAETALRETRSSRVLSDYAEAHGFEVERGVAGMPTAFIARYGSGRPVIGIVGEFDALPGLSQKAQPEKEALEPGAPGHGCGHNLFGAASLGAALAVKNLIEKGELKGTIIFFGTPAEEAVGGKSYMVREGLFRSVDAVLAWHPDTQVSAETDSSQAMVDLKIEFFGKAAHAAFDPWNGRSALDGLEIFTNALNMMREHVKPSVRMHYVITDGGQVPNVVPEHAALWCWLRDSKHEGVDELLERARKIAEGAALAAGVTSKLSVQGGSPEMLPNMTGSRVLQQNLEWLGPVPFSADEVAFAKNLQAEAGVEPKGLDAAVQPFDDDPGEPEGGSTDVADVSWTVPTIHLTVATAPAGVPWHSWAVVAASGSPVGQRGMVYAAKALAATMVDYFQQPETLKAMREEFEASTKGRPYKAYIPAGIPSPPGR